MATFNLQGFSYTGWTGPSGFASLDSKITIDRMTQDGANAIAVTAFSGSVTGTNGSSVSNDTKMVQELEQVLYDAQARGLKIMLKPHLGVDDGSFTTSLAPADPAAFFSSYKSMLLGYAQLAQQYKVTVFSIGNELDSLVTAQYLPYWDDIISAVKAVYDGPITYAAAYPKPEEVAFLSKLDYIGVNPYLPLSSSTTPTYQQLVDAWTKPMAAGTWQHSAWDGLSYKDYLRSLSLKYDTPLLLTEIGYTSSDRAALDPGAFIPSNTADQALQSDLYRALFEVWSPEKSWMEGIFSWTWAPQANPAGQDANWATNFDIRGKLAEATVRDGFGGPQLPPVSVGTGDTVVLTVAGDSWNGAPEVVFAANGLIVGKASVDAAFSLGQWQQVTFSLSLKQDELNKLQVYFSNDVYGSGDRNLYLGSISVNGVSYSGQQGTNNVGWSSGTTAVLQINGSVTYNVPYPDAPSPQPYEPVALTVGTGPDALVLRITQEVYQGSAQYVVRVDGQQIGGTLTASALLGAGKADTVTVRGDWASGPHSVEVEFLNDAYGGTATTDRNLHVDGATYNGVAVPNSALHLLSAGTQSFSFTELASPPTGPQTIAGTEGPDTLTGTSRPDSLSGLAGNDVLRGGGSSDTLLGGDGNDRILGGYGDDVITLGAGRDVAIFNGSVGNRRTTHDGADRITDFVSGVDKLDIRSVASAADIAAKVVTGGIEVALATGGKVLLQGLTSLRAGDVTLNGKALPLAVGPGAPAPVLPTTTATVTGTAGADTLAGGTSADLLLGAAGNDTLSAGGSDDVLRGGVGADRLTGGAGKDVFVMARGDGQDWIVDFTPGQDRLWLEGITAAQVTQVAETRSGTSGMTVSLGSGDEFFLARVTAKLPASDIVFA